MTQIHAREIKEMANKLNLNIPDPITISEYMKDYVNTNSKKKPNKLLVDEALVILRQVLDTHVDTVTLTEHDDYNGR